MVNAEYNFGLRLKTNRSLMLLEDWLDQNSGGEWSLVLLDMDEKMDQKEIEIRFQNASDKYNFVTYFTGNSSENLTHKCHAGIS